jgi:hypothetical protein
MRSTAVKSLRSCFAEWTFPQLPRDLKKGKYHTKNTGELCGKTEDVL